MKIPTPDEFTAAHGYRPFPGRWNRWLSAVREGILSAQPQAGRHVTIDEHSGKGTVINIADTSARRRPGGGGCGCCTSAGSITVTFSGVSSSVCAPCGLSAHGARAADVNGVYVLSKISSSACSEYLNTSAAAINIDLYDDFSCATFNSTVSGTLSIDAACYNNGAGCKWFIEADLAFAGGGLDCSIAVFYSDGTDAARMPITNQCPGGRSNCATTGGQAVIS